LSFSKARENHSWVADPERKVLVSMGGDFNELETVERFKDFVFRCEWRFPPGGPAGVNGSGIVVRARGVEKGLDPRGIEIDLRPVPAQDPLFGTGCFTAYGTRLRNPSGYADGVKNRHLGRLADPEVKPNAEWNTCEVECLGDRIKVTMNDSLVNEAWGAADVAGTICLRNQNAAIEFRNVRLSPVPSSQPSPVGEWIERRPGTPVGDRIRTFSADGKLLVYLPKSRQRSQGTWRQEGRRVYFRDNPAPDAEERFFDIKEFGSTHLTIMMDGKREYRWEALR
ncbi:MAG: hypothetical protein B7Z73_18545, partial [Planctomycetia bacterium 21-64-5]